MKILFLDDDHYRCTQFRANIPYADIVNTADEAIYMMQNNGPYDIVCLDHDLGGQQMVDERGKNTGSEVVRQMVNMSLPAKHVIVHSFNASAAHSMVLALMRAEYTTYNYPFGKDMITFVSELADYIEEQNGNE